jgi:hypothetical protein
MLDVHGMNVVGSFSVMGGVDVEHRCGRRHAAVIFPITSLRNGTAQRGRVAVAAVFDCAVSDGAWELVSPELR